jgi:hypothetical protein
MPRTYPPVPPYSEKLATEYIKLIRDFKRKGITIETLLDTLPANKREEAGKALLAGHQHATLMRMDKKAKEQKRGQA